MDAYTASNMDIRAVDPAALVDIRDVKVNTALPKRERILDFIRQIENPYCYRHGKYMVRVSFADTDISLEDRLEAYGAGAVRARRKSSRGYRGHKRGQYAQDYLGWAQAEPRSARHKPRPAGRLEQQGQSLRGQHPPHLVGRTSGQTDTARVLRPFHPEG